MKTRWSSPPRFLCLSLLAFATSTLAGSTLAGEKSDLHQQLLDQADRQQKERRAAFAAVKSRAELAMLQTALRAKFLKLIGGLPENKTVPPAQIVGTIEAPAAPSTNRSSSTIY